MYKVIFTLTCLFSASTSFSQDYTLGIKDNEGNTPVYKTYYSGTGYARKSVTRYGIIDKKKTLVLPILYNLVFTSMEPGLYIVKDTFNKVGLYSLDEKKFIVEPAYYEIETFNEGLAVVKKREANGDFVWGAIDTKGNFAIPLLYDYVGTFKEGLANVGKGRKYGFVDRNNKTIIPLQYENIAQFGSGLAPARFSDTELYGYINKNNIMQVPQKYVEAESFYKGYAAVKRKKASTARNGIRQLAEVALIDATGKEITGFDYTAVSLYMEGGLFKVSKEEKAGIIDSTGKIVLPVEYKDINITGNGNIVFRKNGGKYGMMNNAGAMIMKPEYDYISGETNGRLYAGREGKYQVMDNKMKVIIPADSAERTIIGKNRILMMSSNKVKVFDVNGKLLKTHYTDNIKTYSSGFIAGEDSLKIEYDATVQLVNLATGVKKTLPYTSASPFSETGVFMVRKIKYSFYDYTGKKLNSKDYYGAGTFSEGIAALQDSAKGKFYLADKNFSKIKDLNYEFVGPYSEGVALAKNTGSLVYLDKKGEIVFSLLGTEGGPFINGRTWIKSSYDYKYVDRQGKTIGSPYTQVGLFSEGLAPVKNYGNWGFMDTTGKLVIPMNYTEIAGFTGGAAIGKIDGKYKLIDKKGQPVDDVPYEGAGAPANGTFPVMKGKLVGLIDSKGKTVIDFKYSNLTAMSENRLWALKDGKWGLVDNTGKELTGFLYKAAGGFDNGYAWVNLEDKYGLVNKTGKLVLPAAYTNIGLVYKNMVVAVLPAGTAYHSLR